MARLAGTAAIVTGAAQGIGATYAKALAAEGARVGVCDLDPPDTVVQAIREAGGEAIGRVCDVSDPAAVAALVQATERVFGGPSTICRVADPTQVSRLRQLRDASTVMRFPPAHQSIINRRFDDRASCPARKSPKQALACKPRIYSPAPGNGGHESGSTLTPVSRAGP